MVSECQRHARHHYSVETHKGVNLYSGTSRILAEQTVDAAGERVYFVAERIVDGTMPVYCSIESDSIHHLHDERTWA